MGQIRLKDASGNFTGQSLYLEFRRQLPPFDVFPSVALAHRGLSIRLASENLSDGSNTNLFDLKPSTISGEDGMLLSGNSFTSSYYGVSISTLSVSPMFGARVKVELSR